MENREVSQFQAETAAEKNTFRMKMSTNEESLTVQFILFSVAGFVAKKNILNANEREFAKKLNSATLRITNATTDSFLA